MFCFFFNQPSRHHRLLIYYQYQTTITIATTNALFINFKQRNQPSCGDKGPAGLLLVLSLSCSDGALFRRGAGSGPLADELPAGPSADSSEKSIERSIKQ